MNNELIIDHAVQISHLAKDSTDRCSDIQSALQGGATANTTTNVSVSAAPRNVQQGIIFIYVQ